jgi:phage host-nuclease inhibitor protein Gam
VATEPAPEDGTDGPDPPPELPAEGFRVHDDGSANWVVRKIVEARQYRERVERWAATEIRRSEQQERFFLDRYGRQLEEWCRQKLESDGGRRRSVSLPAGVVGLRRTHAGLDITDERKLLDWCKRHLKIAVAVRETVVRAALNDHFTGTGELPEGVEVRVGGEKFYVK